MRLGTCEICHATGVWVNLMLTPILGSNVLRERQACAECFEREGPVRSPGASKSARMDDGTGAGWDNVVRAYEEDR